jgi:hypothetical protein
MRVAWCQKDFAFHSSLLRGAANLTCRHSVPAFAGMTSRNPAFCFLPRFKTLDTGFRRYDER